MAEITWIKFSLEMFDNRKIKQIRKLPGGNDLVLFWIMLLTLAGKSNSQGFILLTENIPYTPEMLAVECDIDLNTVKFALDTFQRFDMIDVSNKCIEIIGWTQHQNIEGMEKVREQNRLRKQRQRENQKRITAPANDEVCAGSGVLNIGHEMSRDSHAIEQEIDKEIDKEITTTSSSCSEILNHFEKCNFRLSPIAIEKIKGDIELFGSKWVMEAAEEADNRGKHTYSYYRAILDNWQTNGKANKKKNETDSSKSLTTKPFEFED